MAEIRLISFTTNNPELEEAIRRHPAGSSLTSDGGGKRHIKVFYETPSYEDWCETNGLDPEDDNNYISYCEWKANS